jgi:hypothetical protein
VEVEVTILEDGESMGLAPAGLIVELLRIRYRLQLVEGVSYQVRRAITTAAHRDHRAFSVMTVGSLDIPAEGVREGNGRI